MNSPRAREVAKRYIAYRDQRSIARKAKTRDMFHEIIEAKNNDITRENANMNTDSPAGMMMKFASETTKPSSTTICCRRRPATLCVPNTFISTTRTLSHQSLTCVQHPLDHILEYGFVAGHGESRPAKRIETASIIACIVARDGSERNARRPGHSCFRLLSAPFVRSSFEEEGTNIEKLPTGRDLSSMKETKFDDYEYRPLEATGRR